MIYLFCKHSGRKDKECPASGDTLRCMAYECPKEDEDEEADDSD